MEKQIKQNSSSSFFKQYRQKLVQHMQLNKIATESNLQILKLARHYQNYIQSIDFLAQYKKQQLQKQSKLSILWQNFYKNLQIYPPNIIGQLYQIRETIKNEKYIKINHKQIASQGLLLALFYSLLSGTKVNYIHNKKSLRWLSKKLTDPKDPSQIESTRYFGQKQNINFIILQDNIQKSKVENTIIIIDVFNLQISQYLNFIMQNKQVIQKQKQIILYYSEFQQKQIQYIDKYLRQIIHHNECFELQIKNQNLFKYKQNKNQIQILEEMIHFINQNQKKPQKADIVIFVPSSRSLNKYQSKLNKTFLKLPLFKNTQVISNCKLSLIPNQNHIFLALNYQHLLKMNHDYSKVCYLIDHGQTIDYNFNTKYLSCIEYKGYCTAKQKSKRISFASSLKISRYISLTNQLSKQQNQHISYQYLNQYLNIVLNSIKNNQVDYFIKNKFPHFKQCLQYLQKLNIIQNIQNKWQKKQKSQLTQFQSKQNPIILNILQQLININYEKQIQKWRYTNLALITLIALSKQKLLNKRIFKYHIVNNYYDQLWNKSGYIESFLQIITKCQSIDHKDITTPLQSILSKRLSQFKQSSINQQQLFFSSFYQLCEQNIIRRTPISQMTKQQFVQSYFINEDILNQILNQIQEYRQKLKIPYINIIINQNDIKFLIKLLTQKFKDNIAYFTGSTKKGYVLGGTKTIFKLSQANLFNQYKKYPQIIIVHSFQKKDQQIYIRSSTSIPHHLSTTLQLPLKSNISLSEAIVQFHGIPSIYFQYLFKHNRIIINNFQQQNNCQIQTHQQFFIITIHCHKQQEKIIKINFQNILDKLKQKIAQYKHIYKHVGKTSLLFGSGGSIQDIIKDKYITKCLLSNISKQATLYNLQDLFQQFVAIKSIAIKQKDITNQAIINFYSQGQYQKFKQIFQGIVFYDEKLSIKPIVEEIKHESIDIKYYIQFIWFVWKSQGKAIVKFNNQNQTNKVYQEFVKVPKIDGTNVNVKIQGNTLVLQNLNPKTDQICINRTISPYGKIQQIFLYKSPLKQISGQLSLLQRQIQTHVTSLNNIKYQDIKKGQNGMRSLIVQYTLQNQLLYTVQKLNQTVDIVGQGKLYAITHFKVLQLIPSRIMKLNKQIIQQTYAQFSSIDPYLSISYVNRLGQTYLQASTTSKGNLLSFLQKTNKNLQPQKIKIPGDKQGIFFTQIGCCNIKSIQDMYPCKFNIHIPNKTLHVICSKKYLIKIQEQIKLRLQDNFCYKIKLTNTAYSQISKNNKKIQELKQTYKLNILELQHQSMNLIVQGAISNIQKCSNYIMHFSQSLKVCEQKRINQDSCGICASQLNNTYRFQKCGHVFCKICISKYIQNVLANASLFPFRCPHCLDLISLKDLQASINYSQIQKWKTIAINTFIGSRPKQYKFCCTIGCKQLNVIQGLVFVCDLCSFSYCNLCNEIYHPGYKCQQIMQIRQSDSYFQKYMKQNGIRQCPNCQTAVVKIDGCNKVLCTRCNKSMCFKCPPDKMIAYNTPGQAYDHLNAVHGGYY